MEHRIYQLNTKVQVMGLELSDLAVYALSFFLNFRIIGSMLPSGWDLAYGIGMVALTFIVWTRVKDFIPSHFFEHLVSWIAENTQYQVTPDIQAQPLIVDYDRIADIQSDERTRRIRIRNAQRALRTKTKMKNQRRSNTPGAPQ